MQREPGSRRPLPWLLPLAALAAVLLALFARGLAYLPYWTLMLGICLGAIWTLLRVGAPGLALLRGCDEMSGDEEAVRQRLASLRAQADQMEVTLRDLRSLALTGGDATRARWAESELEETLSQIRRSMASDRAALTAFAAVRWLAQLEPLLDRLEALRSGEIADWCGRLVAIRAQGAELQSRLALDGEAADTRIGRSVRELLDHSLAEVDVLRAELLTRRARREGSAPAGPAHLEALPDAGVREPHLRRLREALDHARARQEVRAWLGLPASSSQD